MARPPSLQRIGLDASDATIDCTCPGFVRCAHVFSALQKMVPMESSGYRQAGVVKKGTAGTTHKVRLRPYIVPRFAELK